ncbi:MAG: hypothetical protein KKC55_17755 [Gammaproteobacteria bacterium]|uniref:Uncharacterized protein n=1 Tax=viral metagenome TaxID=1070528 RepID=A0A6M3M5A7_9ZZZZ|nr:hypothetical protein [Gammaproteobacteria bacterium]
MSSQDEFQTWALNEGYIDFRQEAGRYVNPTIRAMWIGWQASRAELVVELPGSRVEDVGAWLPEWEVRAAIEAAGIRTK